MIVGTATSKLVDPADKRMIFNFEEIDSAEGQWYQSLIHLNDPVGSIRDLASPSPAEKRPSKTNLTKKSKTLSTNTKSTVSSKIISIEEIGDDENDSTSEDDDLPTYEKPDTDEEDEDEDPTLVQRHKPLAPVSVIAYAKLCFLLMRDIGIFET